MFINYNLPGTIDKVRLDQVIEDEAANAAADSVHLADNVKHITSTERTAWNAKADKTYIDNQLALKANSTDVNSLATAKADVSYVDTKIASLASGSPKAVYATLADLQAAFPTGDTNIYLVTADGNWYYWNSSAWVSGGVYQATSIADNSITPNALVTTQIPNKKTLASYTTISGTTSLYILNQILQKGLVNVVGNFIAGTQTIVLLRRNGNNLNFTVVATKQFTAVSGINTLITNFLATGDGTEYIGVIGAGIKYSTTGGNGWFEVPNFNTSSTSVGSTDNSSTTYDFGIYPTYQDVGIIDKINQVLPDVYTPVVKPFSKYDRTPGTTSIYIPVEPLKSGYLKVVLNSASAVTGKLYVLQKNGSNYTVKFVQSYSLTSGQNTLDTGYLCAGDGTEYIGFSGIPIYYNSAGGTGFFEKSETNNYKVGNIITSPSQSSTTIDFAIYYQYTSLIKSKLAQAIRTLIDQQHNFTDYIVVAKSGGDCTTVTEATAKLTNDTTVIYLMPGIYDGEAIDGFHTNYALNIVGMDRDLCIIQNSLASYETPPLEITRGVLKNVTVKALNDGTHVPSGASLWGTYAVHADWNSSSGHSLVFENCKLISYWNAAIGIGMQKDFDLIFRNCEMYTYSDYDAGNNVGLKNGAVLLHNNQGDAYVGDNQNVTLDNCRIYGNHGNSLRVEAMSDEISKMYIRAINTVTYTDALKHNSVSVSATKAGTQWQNTCNVFLKGESFGNSSPILNAQ
ncbi:MAG: hypothetical protein Q8904_15085 [Bacteroidota bacterium]|nr:hypothetical protein [Bacteroidota bacterium]